MCFHHYKLRINLAKVLHLLVDLEYIIFGVYLFPQIIKFAKECGSESYSPNFLRETRLLKSFQLTYLVWRSNYVTASVRISNVISTPIVHIKAINDHKFFLRLKVKTLNLNIYAQFHKKVEIQRNCKNVSKKTDNIFLNEYWILIDSNKKAIGNRPKNLIRQIKWYIFCCCKNSL